MSNLPPGVSEGDIPGNRASDTVFERWLEGRIGSLLAELSSLSMNDISGWVCQRCNNEVDESERGWVTGEGYACFDGMEHDAQPVPWPPFDVEDRIVNKLRSVMIDLGERVS